ncbi:MULTISPECIES: cytochrome b/b6 domain-containing protein [Salinibaculum]|uniref:cytochrome b/b6 domain-containing protein n=1 Tax=Salinibaculum TaxID=2732368 RepID=UPI0030CC1E5E
MADTNSDTVPDGGAVDSDRPPDESMDHGGIIDIERLPGGSRLTAIRADLVRKYEGYQTLDESDKESIRRWGLGSIVSHWVTVVAMTAAAITGLMIWTGLYGPVDVGIWGGYQTAFTIHVWMGLLLAVVALVVFTYYHRVVDKHRLLLSTSQLKEQLVIAFALVGLVRYIPGYKQARRAYDEDREHWVGYHPAQTAFWYALWFFVLLLTLTGFALWAGLATDPAWWVSALGFMQGWLPFERMLQLHLVATFLTLATIAVHVYVAVLPGNRDFFGSMLNGTVEAWVVDEESRPEPADPTAEADPGEAKDDD